MEEKKEYLMYIYETLSVGTLYRKDYRDLQNKSRKMRRLQQRNTGCGRELRAA